MLSKDSIQALTNAGKGLLDSARRQAIKIIPASMSDEKKFANGTACALALVTAADKKIEINEVEKVLEVLGTIDQLKELDLVGETKELYRTNVLALDKSINCEQSNSIESGVNYTFEKSRCIDEIKLVKENEQNADYVKKLVHYVMQTCEKTHPDEIKAKKEIFEALK